MTFTVAAYPRADWTGEYFFGEDGGETAGGTKIHIAHTIKITENEGKLMARIYSQGFQTSIDIYADVEIKDNKLSLLFRSVDTDHLRKYEVVDRLFTIKSKDKSLTTNWETFKPVLEKNRSSGSVRFVRVGTIKGT